MNKNRTLIIGLDGATWELIEPWIEEGHLPNLESLMEKGISGDLESTIPPITAAAWTTFLTGKNPGKHGIYDFVKSNKNLERKIVNSTDVDSTTIWDILSESGREIVSINVPNTYPVWDINGLMIGGMMTPDKQSLTKNEEFTEKIDDLDYDITPQKSFAETDPEDYLNSILEMMEKRFELTRNAIESRDWEVFMSVFSATDTACHWFWKYMDESHPQHIDNNDLEDAILQVYKKADEYLGELVEAAGEETNIIVISDHGFGPLKKSVNLNQWLLEEDYLKLKPSVFSKIRYFFHNLGWNLSNIEKLSRKLGFDPSSSGISEGQMESIIDKLFLSSDDIDKENSKAVSMNSYGPIYLLDEEIKEKLIRDLKKIKDPNGDRLFDEIYRREEIYEGDNVEIAPDLILFTKNLEYVADRYFEFGSNKFFYEPPRAKSGDHRMEGIFLASGPDISEGKIQGAKLRDLAPTILHLNGLKKPEDMDGEVLQKIMSTKIKTRSQDKIVSDIDL